MRRITVVLFFTVNWRRLFVIGTILTVVRVVFQISSLPNPLTEWIISPPLDVSSYQRLINRGNNSRERSLSVTSDNQLKMSKHLSTVVSLNSTAKTNQSMRVHKLKMSKRLPAVVSLNSTAKTMRVLARRERLLRRRRQKKLSWLKKIVYPPPPVVPDHLKVSLILCL